ncbi:GET1-like isoform X3 [Olea europaea subsp. europaea]|uniref:GET1-like isoform X3 n=1 Tax=Olea europaea subsp. europaea TaxID=158383 RepID=A0A8S0RVW9_OLEEU|nr:GET1-like isoform X3 [Olea europaea subsp. europaea]
MEAHAHLFYLADQEIQKEEVKSSYDTEEKILKISNVLAYVVLIIWFRRMPVGNISEDLVQPFGRNHPMVDGICQG